MRLLLRVYILGIAGMIIDDHQLIRTLRSVGMEVFETFYDQFADESLTNQQIVALLKEQRNYTE